MDATSPRARLVPLRIFSPEITGRLLDMPAGIRRMTIHGPGAVPRVSALRTPGAGKARRSTGVSAAAGVFVPGYMAGNHSKQEMDKISITLR